MSALMFALVLCGVYILPSSAERPDAHEEVASARHVQGGDAPLLELYRANSSSQAAYLVRGSGVLLPSVHVAKRGGYSRWPQESLATLQVSSSTRRHREPEHGDDEQHGHDDEHGQEAPIAQNAPAYVLFGQILLVIAFYYLTHSNAPRVVTSTWKTLAGILSIMVAIHSNETLNDMAELVFPRNESFQFAAFKIVQFVSFFVLLQIVLFHFRYHPKNLRGWGLVGAHITGFVAVDIFTEMQEHKPWNTVLGTLAVGLMALTTFVILIASSDKIREKLYMADGVVDQEEDDWIHICIHVENEIIGFCMGAVLTQTCRCALTGEVPEMHGKQYTDKWLHVIGLFFCGGVFGTLMLLTSFYKDKVYQALGEGKAVQRVVQTFNEVMAMSMAWSFFFAGRWLFWKIMDLCASNNAINFTEGPMMIASMIQACAFFVVGFSVILSIELFAGDLSRSLNLSLIADACILLIGLSCENTFSIAVHALAEGYTGADRMFVDTGLSALVVLIVMPALILFILPQSHHGHDHDHDHAPGENGDHDHGHSHEHG